jgi:hypothetical protein
MTGRLGEAIWSKPGAPPTPTPSRVRAGLAEVFTLMSPGEFEANIDAVRRRVDGDHSELTPGNRETWLDFEFYPALPADDLDRLRAMSQALAVLVEAGQRGPIDCLPLFVAHIQLRIYLTLLLGDHAATGRALAAYSAVMRSASEYHGQMESGPPGALPEEQRPEWSRTFDNHGGFAEYMGRRLMAYGQSHEFSDQSEHAHAAWDAIFNATRASVDEVYTRRQRPPDRA